MGVGHVLALLPDVDRVVSPFFGGGSVEIAISQKLGLEVIGYDIFDILVNYWQHQIAEPELLYQELSKLQPTQEGYDRIKDRLEDHWDITTKTFDGWFKACRGFNRYKSYFKDNDEIINLQEQKKQTDDKKEKAKIQTEIKGLINKQKEVQQKWGKEEWSRKEKLSNLD